MAAEAKPPADALVVDFVIVGAGTAGCVLAARLAQAHFSVAVLEAGDDGTRRGVVHRPLQAAELQRSAIDWRHTTTNCGSALGGRSLPWPAGRIVGGSSAIGRMVFARGNKADYDQWAAAAEAPQWSYENVLPYFQRLESCSVSHASHGAARGRSGPCHVSDHTHYNHCTEVWIEAAQQCGLPYNADYNDASQPQEGVARAQVLIHNGARVTAASAYLWSRSAAERPTIICNARVTRILFDEHTPLRACGVEYLLHDAVAATTVSKSIYARKEVIVAAGVVASPQLLLLSGIGPASHLHEHRIPVVCDRPGVGANLQDQLMVPVPMEILQAITMDARVMQSYWNSWRYQWCKSGPLSWHHSQALAFLRTSPDADRPDCQLRFYTAGSDQVSNLNYGYPPNHNQRIIHSVTTFVSVLRPHSRGSVRLSCNNPLESPLIEPNYLSDPRDCDVLLNGFQTARKIYSQYAFHYIRRGEVIDKDIEAARTSDDYVRQYIAKWAVSASSAVGTCKMGPRSDESAVVDAECRVYGVQGLRVIDASILPLLPSADITAAVLMVGEKMSDSIVQQYSPSSSSAAGAPVRSKL